MLLTLLDVTLSITLFSIKCSWNTTRFIYRKIVGETKEKTDYEKMIDYMEERNKKIDVLLKKLEIISQETD